ncbi:5'-nucleotidase C-terminal domain-containing protein [Sporosarcina sp. Sa2YVA2]|uniref:5'-nucleotidase C-terminal domain-containing protein n=1 Tax=Sporosarcina quadrami TaxID=2762234 RepID=A0ABR8UAE5_9BACL|nr:5'-nucleotidase C-terminal domain-containing protein [Sporosarcina quadrami]MBD7984709.1 5'-nucleotidase C-terminal domain-containing protein [Sporosarcina quadrami]
MSKKYFKGVAASMLLFSVAGITPVAVSAEEASKDFSMTVFHTNDTHAHLKDISYFSALLKAKRAETPHNVLLNAGDVFSGTLYFNEFQGQADLAFMNYFGYDAMTFGNHEFDLGSSEDGHKALAEFIKGAKFPFVSANVDFSADANFEGLQTKGIAAEPEDGKIFNGIVKEVNGEKVGIFGLTTKETEDISSPEKITFTNYITEAKEAVAAFEEIGVNKIIALTHIGFDDNAAVDNDQELAKNVPGIDIIVGGHTHSKLEEPKVIEGTSGPVIIVQADQYHNVLGQLDVTFDENGVVKEFNGVLHTVDTKEGEKDPEAEKMLQPFFEKVEATMTSPTGGVAEVFLSGLRGLGGVRAGETNLGNIITDGMLGKAKEIDPEVTIAFQNGGGIRSSIDKGEITFGEVLTVLPFGNNLAIMQLSGAEIRETFEHSLKEYPKENGGFLHVAGMKVVFDGTAEPGKRIVSLKINGEEVEADKMYKAATNVFTARGGDGFEALGKAYEEGRASEPGFSDWENLADHVKSLNKIPTGLEGRIIATVPYSDVNENHWSYAYISDLYYRDILTDDATFKPGEQITRAEMVSWIVKAQDLKSTGDAPFSDLDGLSDDLKTTIAAAYENGIIKGTDGKFMPNDKVTRAQFALILDRALEKYTGEKYTATEKAPYSDFGKYSEDAVNAISMLHDYGIATGYEGKFMPEQFTTHQQAAKIISNFIYATKQVKKAE